MKQMSGRGFRLQRARRNQRCAGETRRGQRGQSLIEASAVLTVVVVFLALLYQFALLLIHLEAVKQIAREAARAAANQGSLYQGCAAAIAVGQADLAQIGLLGGATITVSTTPANQYARGNMVSVVMRVRVPRIFGGSDQVTSRASEQIEPLRSHWPGQVRQTCSAST